MGDFRSRVARGGRFAAVAALAALGSLAFGAPAFADPPGINGTIKVEGETFEPDIANEPHVTCKFQVKLFDFDADQHGDITFYIQQPSGPDKDILKQDKNVLLSNDAAGGGNPDPDEVYTFTADQLGLDKYTMHPKQGYHVKVQVDDPSVNTVPKFKVFWLSPCSDHSDQNGGGGDGGDDKQDEHKDDHSDQNGGGGGSDDNGGLPITGPAAGGIALAGLGLLGGGATLVVLRRRRSVTFTS
jgi:hypothetical protein